VYESMGILVVEIVPSRFFSFKVTLIFSLVMLIGVLPEF
jgi:hypothetical protein